MSKKTSDNLITIVMRHYQTGSDEMDQRRTRHNGWDEIVKAYMGELPADWPYLSMVSDPRIRTTIVEKNARLINSKLQGRLVPREGGDVLNARINNAILNFQWDQANEGGSMLEKVQIMDQQTRLFGSSFGLVYWRYASKTTDDGEKVTFDGPEFKVIDGRDIFIDPAANHIKNARWVQIREFTTIEKLKELYAGSKEGWSNLDTLEEELKSSKSDTRTNKYIPVVKSNRGVDDQLGNDVAFKTVEIVTEWRKDRCIVFAPQYKLILKDTPNPFNHNQIPVVQLRYYPLGEDVWGESEVESVLPLQRAINAILCGFLDEMNLKMRPPLKIVSTNVKIETIEYGPSAKWLVSHPNDVVEMQSNGEAVRNFQSAYSALVASFNTAMGETSLGVSNVGNFQKAKTATEVNKLITQQNNRDQNNQIYLEQMLKDLMLMWLSMNQQFLFSDPSKEYFILKIVGRDNLKAFKQFQLDEEAVPEHAVTEIADLLMSNPGMKEDELANLYESLNVPTNGVITNPTEKNPAKYKIEKKFSTDKTGHTGVLYITPDDIQGVFDYIPDVRSMALGAGEERLRTKQEAIQLVLNPSVQGLLQRQNTTINIKELLTHLLEDIGYGDAEGLFEENQMDGANQQTSTPLTEAMPLN